MYNIKMVVKQLGLTAGTIRAWENRYGVVNPIRSEGGHRLYSDEDVEDLRWLQIQTIEKGLSISQAAQLLKKKKETLSPPSPQVRSDEWTSNYIDLQNNLFDTLIALELEKANSLVDLGFSMYPFEAMLHGVFVPFMVRIGNEWEAGKISVAQEHLMSEFVLQRCMQFFRLFPIDPHLPKAVAACPSGEHHHVGLLFFSLYLRRKGLDVIYLGANTPVEGISTMIKGKQVEYLCLSLTDPKLLKDVIKYMSIIQGEAPHVKLVLGGKGFNSLPDNHPYSSNRIGEQIESWERWYRREIG